MKRQLDDCAERLHRKVGKRLSRKADRRAKGDEAEQADEPLAQTAKSPLPREESKLSDWTPEEDELIMCETNSVPSTNWKTVCKRMNRKFKGKHRTARDCQQRWAVLVPSKERRQWTTQSDLLLILAYYRAHGDWSHISGLFPAEAGLRPRLLAILLDTAKRAKEERYEDLARLSPLGKLQLLVCIELMMEKETWTPEVMEAMQQEQIEEEHCAELLRALGVFLMPKAVWNKSVLDQYVANATEKLQNLIYAFDQNKEGMDDIMHVRPASPEAPSNEINGVQYYLVPIPSMGPEYFMLALCYVRPPPPQL